MEKIIKENWKTQYILTNEECNKMIEIANIASQNTYPKKWWYATCVLTTKWNIYEWSAYSSDTWTLTMHGEMVALAHAALHGESDIVAIVWPNCHICKQLIYENSLRSKIDITIIIQEEWIIKQIPISEMMIYPRPDEPTV